MYRYRPNSNTFPIAIFHTLLFLKRYIIFSNKYKCPKVCSEITADISTAFTVLRLTEWTKRWMNGKQINQILYCFITIQLKLFFSCLIAKT